MLNKEKYVDGLTEEETEDMAIIVNKTIEEICLFSDKHNFDRDNMLKYYAELIGTLAEISTIQGLEVEKPQTNADRIRRMTDEELTEVLFGSCIERMGVEECSHPVEDLKGIPACKSCVLDWLKAESEGEDAR